MRKLGLLLLTCVLVLSILSCRPKTQESKDDAVVETVELNQDALGAGTIDNNDTLPGKTVVEKYGDNQAKMVAFYKVDENGQLTDEKYREVYYYDSTHYKYIEGNLDQSRRDGDWYAYHKNGNLCTEAHYVNGREEGEYKVYHDNGYLYYCGNFKNGLKEGEWKLYDEQGRLMYSQLYENGTLKETREPNNNNNKK
jgi:antitoxin component YwqK of YwqJK toxin-antitoxin module